jgi:type II secretory pathway component PulK
MKHRIPSRRRGSVLILALWALLLLSAAIFAWVKFIDLNITVTGDRNNGLEAKALAHSGVMVALHPQVTQLTPLLTQWLDANRGYQVQMTGEAGKLNLNWLFSPAQNPDPGRISLFQRYLSQRGLNLQQRERLTDCILDWLTPGNVPRLNGAKSDGDYQTPGRGVFLSVDELALVKGSQPLVSQAGWQADFTIYTNPGTIDLQSAPLRVLECLPSVGSANAVRFLKFRQGPDGVDGTADDYIFKDVNTAISYLGLNNAQAQALAPYVEIENPLTTVHIRSTGQCGNVYRHVEVVAKKQGMQPIIMSWKEL